MPNSSLVDLVARFLNLANVGSITPAGVLLSVALILSLEAPTASPGSQPSQVLLSWLLPQQAITLQLQQLNHQRQTVVEDLRTYRQTLVEITQAQAQAQAALDNATALRDHARGVFLERWETQNELRVDAQQTLRTYQTGLESANGRVSENAESLAGAQAAVDTTSELLQSLDTTIAALRAQHAQHTSLPVDSIIARVISLGLLGLVLGTVLTPINKGLLVFVSGRLESGPGKTNATGLRRSMPHGPFLAQHAVFYIGKNVITQKEYDALLNRYYRFAQIAISLILPVLALGLALSKWHICYLLASAATSLVLLLLGRWEYRRFRKRADDFIRARIHDLREKRRREDKRQQTLDAPTAAALMAKLQALSEKLDSFSA